MRKLVFIVFAAIFALNMGSCRGPNLIPEFPAVDLALVALDNNNADLLDTTNTNDIIDVRKVKIYGNDISKVVYFDGAELPCWNYSGVSAILDKIEITYAAINIGVRYSDSPNELSGGCIVDWGNGILDTLQSKLVSQDKNDNYLQLFLNGKVVWDNKNIPQHPHYTVYVRRFE